MTTLLKNGSVYTKQGIEPRDVFVSNDKVLVNSVHFFDDNNADTIINCNNKIILPGFVDVHVHLREPGFFYKETIATGTAAAAHGGYTCICPMPNLNPVPSTLEALQVQLDIINKDATVKVVPYGTITMKQNGRSSLSHMEEMSKYVCAFSDDGKGIQTGDLMEDAMTHAKTLNKLIVAHCEDESLLEGGYIHKGRYAKKYNHKGICSESEWKQVERDIALAEKTGVAYHICHVSTKETVDLVRKAKARGVDVTCETAPHYLVLCEDDLQEDGRFKMNPPLRSLADKEALIAGVIDGTIDMIATDHAPHSAEEKSKGLAGSAFGIVGLEIAFSLLYTNLVEKNIISLEKLIEIMAINPRKRFSLAGGALEDGQIADFTIIDLNSSYSINSSKFLSKGHSTPFDGWKVDGTIEETFVNGKLVYKNND